MPTPGSVNRQISRYETTAVYTHPDAKVDIILVHGLNGEPQKTWTAKNGVFWPADLLPASLREARANVLVYGYNADVYSKKHGSNPSDNFIYMHAQTLVTSLTHYRKDEMTSHNPIIWVCHSLGGILVKRALLYSNDLRTSQHEDYRSIYVSTYGIVFLGTPHTGSDIATWGTVLQAMSDAVVPKSIFQSESVLLKTLKRDNETLQNINSHFLDIYQRFKILMAHENHKTDLKGTRMLVVDASSASPQLPGVTYYAIEATHSGMCKFDSKNAPGYRTVATAIREWATDAPDVVQTRWRVENDEKLARAQHEIEERMKPWIDAQRLRPSGQGASTPQQNNETTLPSTQESSKIQNPSRPMLPEPETPSRTEDDEELFPSQQSKSDDSQTKDPIFVRPSVFRPNTLFIGREKELQQLHDMLKDKNRKSSGTSSVLIQSMPGGGKSHLARQYVFEHKNDYPGGIFWIRAKSLEELQYGYYDIAKVADLKELSGSVQAEATDTRTVVKAVQRWLSNTKDWLLVLDGVHFDFEGLAHYIPFAKHTSIIYTSTERTTGEGYQFDNPQILALDPLSKRHAQELLFEEMGKKKPYTQDDLHRAEELVELMDRLPLMIHVAALHLNATREPLAKYLRSYKSRPKAGNLPAYRAVREQLEHRGAFAALNLMSLLAFFGNHIPVELVALGTKKLDRSTPVKSTAPGTRKRSLSSTLKTLIAFSLVERNQSNEASVASSRSTRSVDTAQDSLDILRVHSIVQAFFVDVLDEEKQTHIWLDRAICVFCGAFDASVERVEEDGQTGMPEDYRRLLIHGQRLLFHLDRFEKRYPDLAQSRKQLDLRLGSVETLIDQLNKRADVAASQGSEELIVSVFERTNSLSENDSTTSPSDYSVIDDFAMDDATDTLGSPTAYAPADYNPYHWHIQYPHGNGIPGVYDDTSRTVTPQPPPTEIFDSMSMPDDDETTLRVFGPNHRTIKKHAGRRYRDYAGAWRASSQIVSDPRVTISRENARGFINTTPSATPAHRRSTSDKTTDGRSEAEISLNQIQRVTPLLRRGITALFTPEPPQSRPRLVAGRPSYANARAEEVNLENDSVTPTFSYPPPSSKPAVATIARLKENDRPVSLDGLAPIKISSPLAGDPMSSDAIPPIESPPGASTVGSESVPSPQGSILLPGVPARQRSDSLSRASQPSPSQSFGRFRPPPVPFEVHTSSSLHSLPLSSARNTGSNQLSTYSIDEYGETSALAQSFPNIRQPIQLPYPTSPGPYTVQIPPEAFLPGPPPPWVASSGGTNLQSQGYSSQPLSRDPSHQSNSSHSSSFSPPHVYNNSSLFLNQKYSSSPGSQIMQRPRSRRPSMVETEPSPPLKPLDFDGVSTSYQLYNDSHHLHRNAHDHIPRGREHLASAPLPYPPSQGSGFFSRIRSIRTRSGRRQRRSESAGGRLGGSTDDDRNRGQASGSPKLDQGPISEMSRSGSGSGSGGVRFDNDTLVEFGTAPSPPSTAAMRRSSPRLGNKSPSSALPFRPPRKESRSPPLAKGSPSHPPIGLGIQQRRAS
ncbi:hypothetical protein GGR57DRAFT_474900 [Xylariaceae sp. FL1272]|nr:hypothetical protein GGR57DRAFT_474900 [Xylariaceae sp. FL1272]